MQNENLKTIRDLKGYTFFVPSYQRGYRWTDQEAGDLLQDIEDFRNNPKDAEFYCLQPVVVQKEGDRYRVIDGQQRLTTIFLIIKALEERSHFNIDYQTRPKSAEFLNNIAKESLEQRENIDFYHFVWAYQTIQGFFEDKEKDRQAFLDTLLNHCKVLWYETTDDENEVFRRLNSGKIPLMETEIIKALFLNKDLDEDEDTLKERADFWYNQEKKTRAGGDFAYCVLSHVHEKDIIEADPNYLRDDVQRIEVYLRAIVPPKGEVRYLFKHFYCAYQEGQESIQKAWREFELAADTLFGFASKEPKDREIFHHLGFLTLRGMDIYKIYHLWLDKSNKSDQRFAGFLDKEVKKIATKSLKKRDIEDLQYFSDKGPLQTLLLLFNLAFLIKKKMKEVFRFNRFVLEKWSLEHIYAQKSQGMSKAIARTIGKDDKEEVKKEKIKQAKIKWLTEVLQYIENEDLKKAIQTSLKQIRSDSSIEHTKTLERLLERIEQDFNDNEDLHRISNLTLLDRRANSKIGNLIFSQKRVEIQDLQKEDRLIPITTQKVFNKEFSEKKSDPDVFTKADQKAYLEELKKYLKDYLYPNKKSQQAHLED
ncbi:DUF262 domain-containing protein [Helicobacter ailurogastricus]|uniref:DUF262 domain-containing protein n=1 Tax=Helicobacter ailurogastricus TaxID=1578720 RepID=UPI0018F805B3|nr:DUF262 domain-containing protein [Helicobacter ailurogastricus]